MKIWISEFQNEDGDLSFSGAHATLDGALEALKYNTYINWDVADFNAEQVGEMWRVCMTIKNKQMKYFEHTVIYLVSEVEVGS